MYDGSTRLKIDYILIEMGVDEDLVSVLSDLVEFLESLCDVKLPNSLENVRSDLLRRSRTSLGAYIPNWTSLEPYLEMKPGKGNGLMLAKLENLDDTNLTEYIDADNGTSPLPPQPDSTLFQNEYESFGSAPTSPPPVNTDKGEAKGRLKMIYSSFSAEQTKSTCHKCGPLQQLKDERSIFMKTVQRQRSYWIGLVGTYLLAYANKDAKQPKEISSIRGFSARPAPRLIIGESDRSKSVFEIFRPGSKTLRFIARAPKDMEQWVAAINRVGTGVQSEKSNVEVQRTFFEQLAPSFHPNSTISEEQYQDIGTKSSEKLKDDGIEKDEKTSQEKSTETLSTVNQSHSPPPLPARIPRRLPSLPQTPVAITHDPENNEERDDIYYTIEDVNDRMTYINVEPLNSTKKMTSPREKPEHEMYDDIQETELKTMNNSDERLETYDEVVSTEPEMKDNSRESSKKRLFFNRFKGQKEYLKKEELKKKETPQNITQFPKTIDKKLPTSDDSLGISPERRSENEEEHENYTCPPAPRPVYMNPPVKMEEEIYDDIGHVREIEQVESSLNNDNCEFEHYQVPRAPNPIDPGQLNVPNGEELYDDIAILAEFRARQRDSACSSSSSEKAANNVTKAWSRFASGKKNGLKKDKNGESLGMGVDCRENCNDSKLNKFHKLKSKMEHALNISGKPPTPPINNKCDGH